MKSRLPIRKIVSAAFYALLIIFLALYLRNIDTDLLRQIEPSWTYLLLATIFALAARFWGIYTWIILLKGLGARDLSKKAELIYIYAKAWLARYIPGKIAWILSKIHFASQHGISKNKLAVSTMLEAVLQITTILALSFALLMFDARLDVVRIELKIALVTLLLMCLVAMLPPVFNKLIRVVYKIIRKKDLAPEHLINRKIVATGATLFTVGALISGFSLFLIAKAVYPQLGYDTILFVMGVSNLAGALGMLAVFAPSGLGVREGVQLVLLSIIMPVEFALAITVVTRLWSIIVDFLFFGLGYSIQRLNTSGT